MDDLESMFLYIVVQLYFIILIFGEIKSKSWRTRKRERMKGEPSIKAKWIIINIIV